MKTLSARQRKIINLITQKGDLSVDEVQEALGVSQATAYREIQALIQQGLAAKIPGGVGRIEQDTTRCVHCGRESTPRMAFFIEPKDGARLSACCGHCGLMALANRTDIRSAMTPDFFYGTLLNAANAWYALNSSVCPCCQPSVLSFASQADAERFTASFGGEVADFASAQNKVRTLMQL